MASTSLLNHEPPPSQPENTPYLKGFIDSNSTPLPIFVEANGVRDNRPKLIRTLRNGGADVCHEPSRARIILVDPYTKEGQRFVRDWGSDPGKVVLDASWVHKCINAGRALLEDDGWAGCGDIQVGRISDDEENEDEVEHVITSLPTPRPTPTGPVPSPKFPLSPVISKMISDASDPAHYLQPPSPNRHEDLAYPFSPHPPSPERPSLVIQTAHASQNAPAPMMQPSNLPMVPAGPVGALLPAQYNPALFGDPSFIRQMTYWMHHIQTQATNVPIHLTDPQAWPTQSPISSVQFRSTPMSFDPSIQTPDNSSQQSSEHSQDTGYSSPKNRYARSQAGDFFAEPTPSSSRDPATHAKPSARKNKRLLQVEPRSVPSPGRSTTKSPWRYHEQYVGEAASVSERSTSDRSSSSMFASPMRALSSEDGASPTLFIRNGKPLLFFLQVDIRNRMEVLQLIKKHSGRITSDIQLADHVILASQGSSFSKLRADAIAAKKDALRSTFVQACVEANYVVDEREYVLAEPSSQKSAGRHPGKAKKSSAKPQMKISHQQIEYYGPNVVDVDRDDSRSPKPPTKPVVAINGKNAFTQDDYTYFLQYCRKALRRNTGLTVNRLATDMAERATTHSQRSWCKFIFKHKDKLEDMRREVRVELGIQVDSLSDVGDQREEGKLLKRDKVEEAQDLTEEMTHAIDADIAWDLETIISFFAARPQGDDEYLWSMLAQQHECRTESSWQAFYDSRKDEVEALLESALLPADRSESGASHYLNTCDVIP